MELIKLEGNKEGEEGVENDARVSGLSNWEFPSTERENDGEE